MNKSGNTVLHYASSGKGNAKIARVLIKYGADVHGKNPETPPLRTAIYFEKVGVVKVLIEAGANVHRVGRFDPLITAKDRKTSWESRPNQEDDYIIKQVQRCKEIIKLIEEARAKQAIKNKTPTSK